MTHGNQVQDVTILRHFGRQSLRRGQRCCVLTFLDQCAWLPDARLDWRWSRRPGLHSGGAAGAIAHEFAPQGCGNGEAVLKLASGRSTASDEAVEQPLEERDKLAQRATEPLVRCQSSAGWLTGG
jgi:hypothetical protein